MLIEIKEKRKRSVPSSYEETKFKCSIAIETSKHGRRPAGEPCPYISKRSTQIFVYFAFRPSERCPCWAVCVSHCEEKGPDVLAIPDSELLSSADARAVLDAFSLLLATSCEIGNNCEQTLIALCPCCRLSCLSLNHGTLGNESSVGNADTAKNYPV